MIDPLVQKLSQRDADGNLSMNFTRTNQLRWVSRGPGFKLVLQQAWVAQNTGVIDWKDIPLVDMAPTSDTNISTSLGDIVV